MARRLRVDVSWATVFRVLAAAAIVWVWLRLWQWVLLFIAAAFLAVALDPAVRWLEARRVRRGFAAPLVVFVVLTALAAFLYVGGSALVAQGQLLGDRLGELRAELARYVPAPVLERIQQSGGAWPDAGSMAASMVRALTNAILSIAVAFVLTIYLLLDGRRTFEWLVAFAPRDKRPRVQQTAVGAHKAVLAYMRGNIITSAISAICTYVAFELMGIPAALLLALLAGIFDFIPVVGIILTAVPSVALALTVSPWTAIGAALFTILYNVVENYYISPKVYGHELRLSDLAVLAAFAAGAELGGVIGALIALPIAAMYPAIENIWLAGRLGPEVARDHRRIERSDEH